MDEIASRRAPPAEWLRAIERGRADLAAGRQGVPVEDVIARLRDREARLRADAETASNPDGHSPRF